MAGRSVPILKQLLTESSKQWPRSVTPTRSVTYMPRPGDGSPRPVTLVPGDGIGPFVTGAVKKVMEAMHAPVYFEKYDVHGDMKKVPQEVIDSIKNKVCLKGGLATPMGGGVSSLNVQLRKELDLYASLVNCFNLPGLPTRHQNVDIVVIRENTEGEYSGLEHEVVPGVVESLKVTPNLYGNLVANTAAGIAGGTGVMPGGNVRADHAIFEQGASAGNVGNEKIVEQRKANPVALLLSSTMMLRHLRFPSFADRLEAAVKRVISGGKYRTKDLGGTSGMPLREQMKINPTMNILRPLSPHLTIYKPQLTSMLSISHRISGAFLSILLLFFHLLCLKMGLICFTYENFYQFLLYCDKLIPITVEVIALALSFHLYNGVRHLFPIIQRILKLK